MNACGLILAQARIIGYYDHLHFRVVSTALTRSYGLVELFLATF